MTVSELDSEATEKNPMPEENEFSVRKAQITADLIKWFIGSVVITLITTVGNWTFQYFSYQSEVEKTNRELKIKEKDMQLQYLEKFTMTAIDQDITKRIRLAHYISSTIDDQEYKQLSSRWQSYYSALVKACQDRLKAAVEAKKIDIQETLSVEPACTIGGLEVLKPSNVYVPRGEFSMSEIEKGGPGGPLGELLARGESSDPGYGAFNRGIGPADSIGESIDFSKLSVNEVIARQSLRKDDPKRLFAVGKYLIIPIAMKSIVSAMKIDSEQKFTSSMQENIFRNYIISIKRPVVKAYITGKTDDLAAAQLALASEFASVARPDTGLSNYGVAGDNVASTSAQQTAAALRIERGLYQQYLGQGKTPEAAWDLLSPGIKS